MSPITTHVLDVSRGRPAAGVFIHLERIGGDGRPELIGEGRTDENGRLANVLHDDAKLTDGAYRLRFDVGAYFEAAGVTAFYPIVEVVFVVKAAEEHYHVPLLISPFGYSTYRGS
jgi:5-hydroxyisourate hydrolase